LAVANWHLIIKALSKYLTKTRMFFVHSHKSTLHVYSK
jgi:hypothetical protein